MRNGNNGYQLKEYAHEFLDSRKTTGCHFKDIIILFFKSEEYHNAIRNCHGCSFQCHEHCEKCYDIYDYLYCPEIQRAIYKFIKNYKRNSQSFIYKNVSATHLADYARYIVLHESTNANICNQPPMLKLITNSSIEITEELNFFDWLEHNIDCATDVRKMPLTNISEEAMYGGEYYSVASVAMRYFNYNTECSCATSGSVWTEDFINDLTAKKGGFTIKTNEIEKIMGEIKNATDSQHYIGSTLILDSKITVCHYFTDDVKFDLTGEDKDKIKVEDVKIDGKTFKVLKLCDISQMDYSKVTEVTMKYEDGTECYLRFSVLEYIYWVLKNCKDYDPKFIQLCSYIYNSYEAKNNYPS